MSGKAGCSSSSSSITFLEPALCVFKYVLHLQMYLKTTVLIYKLQHMFCFQFIPVYMHVRVLVAAYLFQTGYGHFSFFWLKGDFGLYRVCQVWIRLRYTLTFFCNTLHFCPAELQSKLANVLSALFIKWMSCAILCVYILSTGAVPAELLGDGTLCGNGQTIPVLLLCPFGNILVCHHLRHNGHVASDPSEEDQQ